MIHLILHKETSPKFIAWTPNTWITDYKKYWLTLKGGKIKDSWVPTLQRKYDVSLMDHLSKYIEDRETLKILNNRKIYLQIFTLSKITSTDGGEVTKCSIHGHRNPAVISLLHWPKQKRPFNKTWRIFAQIIREIFCKRDTLQIIKPLGSWTKKMLKNTQNGTISMMATQAEYTNTMTDSITNGPFTDH